MLPLSIVVPVSCDIRLLDCIASVDVPVEIVVVFNNSPSLELISTVKKNSQVKIVTSQVRRCNLAQAFNAGIEEASHDLVLLTNSDCKFMPGKLQECLQKLQDESCVVKGSILFTADSYSTKLVAELRALFHAGFEIKVEKPLYGPGLAFHRSIRSVIGGYFFDEEMGWGEDGELSERIYSAGLQPHFLSSPMLVHPPENIFHDLKMAYMIGWGEWIQHKKVYSVTIGKVLCVDVLNLFGDRNQRFRLALKKSGISTAIYLLVWKLAAHLGYYRHALSCEGVQKCRSRRSGTEIS